MKNSPYLDRPLRSKEEVEGQIRKEWLKPADHPHFHGPKEPCGGNGRPALNINDIFFETSED